jgi:TM2 domain-containing membrane protein YozV
MHPWSTTCPTCGAAQPGADVSSGPAASTSRLGVDAPPSAPPPYTGPGPSYGSPSYGSPGYANPGELGYGANPDYGANPGYGASQAAAPAPYGNPGYANSGGYGTGHANPGGYTNPGHPPYGAPGGYPPPAVIVAPKSAAVAVLLNILWLGVGNIYAGQVGLGIAFIVIDFFLWLTSLLVITLILTVPLWIVLFVVALVTSISAVNSYNARLVTGRY